MSAWEIKKVGEEYHCFKNGERMAVIFKREKAALPWYVLRIGKTLGGREIEGGVDTFRKLDHAKDFVVNNPGVWGK